MSINLKVNFMNFDDLVYEELFIDSGDVSTDKRYVKLLGLVFNEMYLKKINRVFKDGIKIKKINRDNNIMAITVGTQISVNSKNYDELSAVRANVYLIHETFHVLQNMPQFKELATINDKLCKKANQMIPSEKMSAFLTGKTQDIHSDYTKEFLSYFSNNVFKWEICPALKKEFSEIIKSAGIFNTDSSWWKKRID